MKGLHFRAHKPIEASAPNRMDIACFVGFIGYRNQPSGKLPVEIEGWLKTQGWLNQSEEHVRTLLGVPVPIESWDSFTDLFAWDERPLGNSDNKCFTYLGAAVRSFFVQGGRKCYIVRVGDPLPLNAGREERKKQLEKIIPGYPSGTVIADISDRRTWCGVGYLFGLPDVSFLCMPDLPDILRSDKTSIPIKKPDLSLPPEQFVECSEPIQLLPPDIAVARIPAPRCDYDGFKTWRDVVHTVAQYIATHRREVQLVAGIPLPDSTVEEETNMFAFMHDNKWLSNGLDSKNSISSTFVQLCYPWLRTAGSDYLPEQLETPEGALVGLLARNALTRGTFRSATQLRQRDIVELSPKLRQDQMYKPDVPDNVSSKVGMIDRITLFSYLPQGIQLASDVTTSNDISYRQAGVNRTISLILRAVRHGGEEYAFESSGEQLWALLRSRLTNLLQSMFSMGALRGATPADAYKVRCDRSTMTQRDIDSGRVIAQIQIQPAMSLESIEVLLSISNANKTSLTSLGMLGAAA